MSEMIDVANCMIYALLYTPETSMKQMRMDLNGSRPTTPIIILYGPSICHDVVGFSAFLNSSHHPI